MDVPKGGAMTVKLKEVRKGVYESTSEPKKIDNNRIRQIINREAPKLRRRDEPAQAPRPAAAQAI